MLHHRKKHDYRNDFVEQIRYARKLENKIKRLEKEIERLKNA